MINFFKVKESETFKRIGNNVHVDVDISLSQACLGGVARVPSLYGDVELKAIFFINKLLRIFIYIYII
jgi:DnaJ-class molecular chaperone